MDWSLATVIQIGLRLIAKRDEVAAMWGRIRAFILEAEQLFPDLHRLINDIAPELLPRVVVTSTTVGEPPKEMPPAFDVPWLQSSLNQLLNLDLKIDGEYGEHTRNAVKAFQQRAGLKPDGWAGVLTEAGILNELRQGRRGRQ